jgi:hypothetical protein
VDAGHFLDQVDLLPEIGAPARRVDGQAALRRLRDHGRPDGEQAPLQLGRGQLDAEDLGGARGAEKILAG